MSADPVEGTVLAPPPWWEVVIGAVTVAAGLLVLLLPDRSLLLVAVVVGTQLVVVGLVRLWTVWVIPAPPRVRLLGGVLAAAVVVAGVVCMLRPDASLVLVAVAVGAGWVADGVIEIVTYATGSAADRSAALLGGAVAVLGGIVVIAFPRSTLTALAQVSGAVLIALGLSYALLGLRRWRTASAA